MSKKVGVLTIDVLEGRNLVPMDSDGKSDPYVIIIVGEKKKKTKAVRHTLNPKWENESYEFSIDQNLTSIIVELYDWDRFSSDDRMGMFVIPVEEFLEYTIDTQKWFTLVPIKSEDKVSGDIKLKIRFERTGSTSSSSSSHHSSHHSHHHSNSKDNNKEQDKHPLIKYIKEGDIHSMDNLASKSKIDYNQTDAEGVPSIHLAAASNNVALMLLLLKGSDLKITCRDSLGNTPLHVFAQKCSTLSNDEVILKFIEKGCSVTDENHLGETPLHKACLSQIQKTIVIETLLNKGANINATNKNGDTPFHYAIKLGRSDFVTILIQRGADINKEGGKPPKKPMDLALELNNQSIVNKIKQAQEIIEWLSNLQLEPLVEVFLQNELYLDVVPDIDEATLDRLKITISGHRTKLLRAIKKLKGMSTISVSSDNLSSLATQHSPTSTSSPISTPNHSNGSNYNGNNSNSNSDNNNQHQQQSTNNNINNHSNNSNSSSNNNSNNGNNNNNNNNITTSPTPNDPSSNNNNNIVIGINELSQLKHINLDSDSLEWVIDESQLKYGVLLGTGASGKVYKGFYNDQEVAIKVLKSFSDPKDVSEFKKEFQIVSALRAPGVVYFYGAGFKERLCIVMEYCSRGSLYHILKDESWLFTWDSFFRIAMQAISSLNSLHDWTPQVLHRDLKSLNFLVTENWTVKICDFGLSRFDTGSNLETLGKLRGTYAYVAPEVYFGNKYTTKSDVFSMGMILWEMLYRCVNGLYQFPYQEYPHLKFDYQILISSAKKDVRPSFPVNSPESLVEIIKRSLLKDQTLRPTTSEFYDAILKIKSEYELNREEWDAKRSTPFHSNPNINNNTNGINNNNNNNNSNSSSTSISSSNTTPGSPITPLTTESIKSPTSMLKEQVVTRNRSTSSPINPNFFIKPTENEFKGNK